MRYETWVLLSQYALEQESLQSLREFIEDVDWDDPAIAEDERSVLLSVEARIVGMDEGFNDESNLRSFLMNSMPILNPISWLTTPSNIVIGTQANNGTLIPMLESGFPRSDRIIEFAGAGLLLPQ